MNKSVKVATYTPILARYVKTRALFAILFAILGLWLLQVMFSYLAELDELTPTYTMTQALAYIFYRSPYFLQQFIPTGALLGAVVGLGLLANQSELVVMRAAGVSTLRIVGWVLQPALLFVLLAMFINQFILPISNPLAHAIKDEKDTSLVAAVKGYWTVLPHYQYQQSYVKKSESDNFEDNNKINNKRSDSEAAKGLIKTGNDVLYIGYADIKGNLGKVKRWHIDDTGNLVSALQAKSGVYNPNATVQAEQKTGQNISAQAQVYPYAWTLNDLTQLTLDKQFTSTQTKKNLAMLRLPFAPQSVYLLTTKAEDLSLTQLYAHKQFIKAQNKRSLEHELAFWQKLLSPFTVLSLVIVACSFVFGSLRTHSLGLRIVVALLFGLFFSYLQDLVGFISLATGWSPFIMVLVPIIGCMLLGIYLIKRQQ